MSAPIVSLARAALGMTTPSDRWLMLISGLGLIALLFLNLSTPGRGVKIYRDNRLLMTLPLNVADQRRVEGRLGMVEIQVEEGRARLMEHASPRMIGARTGWISRTGATAACVPCGILLQISGGVVDAPFDAISR